MQIPEIRHPFENNHDQVDGSSASSRTSSPDSQMRLSPVVSNSPYPQQTTPEKQYRTSIPQQITPEKQYQPPRPQPQAVTPEKQFQQPQPRPQPIPMTIPEKQYQSPRPQPIIGPAQTHHHHPHMTVRHPDEAPPIPPRAPMPIQHTNSFNDSTFENVPLRHPMEPQQHTQQNGNNQRRRPQSGNFFKHFF